MASGSRILLKFVSEGIDAFLGLTVNIERGSRYPSKNTFVKHKSIFTKTANLNVVAEPLREGTRTVA